MNVSRIYEKHLQSRSKLNRIVQLSLKAHVKIVRLVNNLHFRLYDLHLKLRKMKMNMELSQHS